jgi:hypothetical protein
MKKLFAFVILYSTYQVYGQDLINAYSAKNYIGLQTTPNYFHNSIYSGSFFYPNDIHNNYNGEYVIYIGHLPYFEHPQQNTFQGSYNLDDFHVSYTIEVVSFPFTIDCAYNSPNGCADNSDVRELMMPPINSYDGNTQSWLYGLSGNCLGSVCELKNQIVNKPFTAGGYSSSISTIIESQALISSYFVNHFPTSHVRDLLPHTVLKHTVNFHCGDDENGRIISSISWIYDNTRGFMRNYPFYPTNSVSGHTPTYYDVIFTPKYYDTSLDGDYSTTENCQFYGEPDFSQTPNYCSSQNYPSMKGGSINYYPFSEIQTGCAHANFTDVNSISDLFISSVNINSNNEYHNIFPSPFSLLTGTFPRNSQGLAFAGMESHGQLQTIGSQNGQVYTTHDYFIDNSINLTDINFSEKKIYNPSEVDITAQDLRFPANYTFLTARGVYAYMDDYIAQTAIPENDFAFYNNDYRQFPIETDLRYEGTNPYYLPHQSDSRYASIYRLLNGSKLTIEPCVHIYDCTFDLKPGSEMVFESWPTNQHNVNRYHILRNGGTLTKRAHTFLFQNRNENEKILKFETGDFIKAGAAVDPANPSGDYIILASAVVQFKATTYIDLQPGFTVDAGAEFTASIDNVVIPPCPPMRKANPKLQDNDQLPLSSTFKFFQASPNPSTKEISFMLGLKHSGPVSLMIYDVFGKLVNVIAENKYLDFGEYSYKYNLENLRSGIYFARLTSSNEAESIKFIKY